MKKLSTRLAALLLALLLFTVPVLALPDGGEDRLGLLEEILLYIETYALYPPGSLSLDGVTAQMLEDDPELFWTITETWLAEDRYGYFMTGEQYAAALGGGAAPAYGIGIQVDMSMPLGVYVIHFLPGGGAEKSGMERGAQIVTVDGIDITDAFYPDIRHLFLDDHWSYAEIGYINPGSAEVMIESIRRGQLSIDAVQGSMVGETDIGYISISSFSNVFDALDFEILYNNTLPSMGAKSVIIDLRGNPGGDLAAVHFMLEFMLPDAGYLMYRLVGADGVTETTSRGWEPEELAAWNGMVWEPEPIIILVDGSSASASEVFAGMLQAYGLATVVGETTFGKSHSQYHLTLSSGDRLIFTVNRIELHRTGSYEDVGIVPDYEVFHESFFGADLVKYDLDPSRALFRHSIMEERIKALQERLWFLGYYRCEPSGVFDDYTLWCLNRFQAVYELPMSSGYANVTTLQMLDQIVKTSEFTIDDAPFLFALELCGR